MFPVASTLGALASVLGRFDDAEGHFAEASELMTRGDMQFFTAATGLAWGRMLGTWRRAGDIDRARTLLGQAREVSVARGYAAVERRAAAVLAGLN